MPAEVDIAVAHLHDLQHLLRRLPHCLVIGILGDAQVPVTAFLARLREFPIVLLPEPLDLAVFQNPAIRQIPVLEEEFDLFLRESHRSLPSDALPAPLRFENGSGR